MFSLHNFSFLTGLMLPMSASLMTATESVVLGMGCFWGAEKRMSGKSSADGRRSATMPKWSG